MYANRLAVPFNPDTYTAPGTFSALLAGMQTTLDHWDDVPIQLALVLPAFYMEGRDRGEEHQVMMFAPTSVATVERERLAVSKACAAVQQRAREDGYDVTLIVAEMRRAIRPLFADAIARSRARAKPAGLLGRLLGR
ncbi:MAG: hypothetical protein ABIQ65_01370 [Thermoanaerobaculia bacterium]